MVPSTATALVQACRDINLAGLDPQTRLQALGRVARAHLAEHPGGASSTAALCERVLEDLAHASAAVGRPCPTHDVPTAESIDLAVIPAESADTAAAAWLRLRKATIGQPGIPCASSPLREAWFAGPGQLGRTLSQAAITACLGCPALDPCRRYAVLAREQFGIWGGTTAQERRSMPAVTA